MTELYSSVRYIKGIGPKKANLLKKLNINSIDDLLYYFPRSYEDRSEISSIVDAVENEKVNIRAVVCGSSSVYRARRGLSITKVPIKDNTGHALLVWFNQDYRADKFKIGEMLQINGKVKKISGKTEIHNPICINIDEQSNNIGKIVPIYPLTESLTNNDLINFMTNAIEKYLSDDDDVLPKKLVEYYKLISYKDAITNIHFPTSRRNYLSAKRRLVFEELLLLQLGLFFIKGKYSKIKKGIVFQKSKDIDIFICNLPFKLTNAQLKVFNEVEADMESENQMNRLIQGDVGSGKTIIAVLAMLKAYKSGFQSVMMVPTEILARQHFESINNLIGKLGIKCELLISSISKKKKEQILKDLKNGTIDLIIGTHAIIQDSVEFNKLGLAITDEQHRFGVRQRVALSNKGDNPDILVMSATPIPRTLALILYGDLDVSIIDELPPGRKNIKTYIVENNMKERIYKFVKNQVAEGRQAYIVCPLVEESEFVNLNSATQLFEELKQKYLKGLNIGLLHGKMNAVEKEIIMSKFKEKLIDVLVSTTVIEVGVNVPNANTMVIENAERFGLAQLHQLRGRVGRGNYQSYCILINESNSKISKARMSVMKNTTDGFVISEKDLEMRGPGQFFGTKQHGLPELKIANLSRNIDTLKEVQFAATKILKSDPELNMEAHKKLKNKIRRMFSDIELTNDF